MSRSSPVSGRPKRRAKVSRPSRTAEAALARVRSIETLEDAYQAWLELRLEHAAASRMLAEKRQRLTEQGEFLVGAVRAASSAGGTCPTFAGPGLAVPAPGLDSFLKSSEAKLTAARAALERSGAQDQAAYARAFERIRAVIRERVERFSCAVKPRLGLMVRHLGSERRILHLSRVKGDEAVLLLFVFARRIPSRYGFLFDDSTEEVALAPPTLYAEEGILPTEIRPGARALLGRLRGSVDVLPVKGLLPVLVPRPEGGEELYRLLQRGPVMEVEIADGDAFRNILTSQEAERFAGHLVRLKLEGRIDLEIDPG